MREISKEELKEIIDKHREFLESGRKKGKCADLSYTDLFNHDLTGVDLQYANLNHANLAWADLRYADLYEADLRHADLSDSDLSGSTLTCAKLFGANLSGAKLSGANLSGTELPEKIIQIGPIGSRNDYTVINLDDGIITCGCWNGDLKEFKHRIDEVYPDDGQYRAQYLAVINLIENLKKA